MYPIGIKMNNETPKTAMELALEAAGNHLSARTALEPLTHVLDSSSAQRGTLDALHAHVNNARKAFEASSSVETAIEAVRKHALLADHFRHLHQTLLESEKLAPLAPMRDAFETLQTPLRLADLKKRASLFRELGQNLTQNPPPKEAPQRETSPIAAEAPAHTSADVSSAADIGRIIKSAREERGMSQQSLAEHAGVGRRFLSELENGKPSLEFDKVLSVARALGINFLIRMSR